ncbi:hypothetical protein V2E67_003135 [Citrobacter freundii]|nr:hypothetical protein [Citrobacter freundii]
MPIISSKASAHYVSQMTADLPQDKKTESHFSTIIKSVKNGTLKAKSHGTNTHSPVKNNLYVDNVSPAPIVKKTECSKQIDDLTNMQHYVNEKNIKLSTEIAKMDAKQAKDIDHKAITAELAKRLYDSVNNSDFNKHGALYKAIMTEESQIITSSLSQKELTGNNHKHLSHNEKLILHKRIAETRLAVADFCLRILRLNEQAEWTPPGDAALNTQSAINADELLSSSMQNALSKPYFESIRGIDADSGLYHEQQFSKSGSCATHANNHYLAAWCERQERPFLALTPRRLELLLSAIQNRQNTEVEELKTMYVQEGKSSAKAKKLVMSDLEKNEKFILKDKQKNKLMNYGENYDLSDMINTVKTSRIWGAKITELINKTYGLPAQIQAGRKDAQVWASQLDGLHQLEKKQDSLMCILTSRDGKSCHATCFNKKEDVWYLQDSNLSSPIKCSPSELIIHISDKNNNHPILSNIDYYGDYRDMYDLDSKALINLSHFEPR